MENRDEFVNRSQGYVGAIKINRKGDEQAIAVEPGGRVFLTAEEQKLTAQSHAREKDSPFVVRHIIIFDLMTHDPIEEFDAPLLEKVKPKPAARPRQRRRKPQTAAAS